MIRDTAERVLLAVGVACLAMAGLHIALMVVFAGTVDSSSTWLGCVGAVMLLAELGYRWLRRRDLAERRRRELAAVKESRYL